MYEIKHVLMDSDFGNEFTQPQILTLWFMMQISAYSFVLFCFFFVLFIPVFFHSFSSTELNH